MKRKRWKYWTYALGGLLILSPLVPFYLLQTALQAGADFLDWCFDDRALPCLLVRQVEKLEMWSYRQ